MTAGAGLRRPFESFIRMAISAGRLGMLSGELEGDFGMIEPGRLPGCRGVAVLASCAKLALVRILFGMTGRAVFSRCFQVWVGVTAGAIGFGMFSEQVK